MLDDTGSARTAPLPRRGVLILIGAATALAAVAGYKMLATPVYDGGHLSVQDAHAQALDGTILLVDIRQPDEWIETGIPEAAHPIDMRRADFIEAVLAARGPDTTRPVALICARGVRSTRLSTRLADAGFGTVLDVPEGMLGSAAGPGWLAQGLPTRAPTVAPE